MSIWTPWKNWNQEYVVRPIEVHNRIEDKIEEVYQPENSFKKLKEIANDTLKTLKWNTDDEVARITKLKDLAMSIYAELIEHWDQRKKYIKEAQSDYTTILTNPEYEKYRSDCEAVEKVAVNDWIDTSQSLIDVLDIVNKSNENSKRLEGLFDDLKRSPDWNKLITIADIHRELMLIVEVSKPMMVLGLIEKSNTEAKTQKRVDKILGEIYENGWE